MNTYYEIPGCVNYNPQIFKVEYQNPSNYPNWLQNFEKLKQLIEKCVHNNNSLVIVRCFDGEWCFMQKKSVGNIPLRHYNKTITDDIVMKFQENINNVDIFTSHLTHVSDRLKCTTRPIDYPMEFLYAIIANRWIFKTFKNQISLICGVDNANIIRSLMEYKEYRDYINQDYFNEIIDVPKTQGCQYIPSIIEKIKSNLQNSKCNIVLYGMGICKLGIINHLKNIHDAIYIDIGHGMDCIAGIGNPLRPYFGLWKNYRMKNFDYSNTYFCDSFDMDKKIYKDSIIEI